MSFTSNFTKLAGLKDKTDIELQYKANKHIRKLIANDKAPLKGAGIGAVLGAGAGGIQKARGKYGKLGAGATALGVTGAGAGAGWAKRKWHSSKGGKYFNELVGRGYYPQSMNPDTGHIRWRPPRIKAMDRN